MDIIFYFSIVFLFLSNNQHVINLFSMKTQAKYLILFIGIGIFTLNSCKKDGFNPKDKFSQEVISEEANLQLSSSSYEKVISESLENDGAEYYTKGIIEYKVNNHIEASINFGDSDKKILVTQGGVGKKFDLKKEKSGYKKVLISPIVKTDDCEYIVEGIIKYYDSKSGEYLAAIDFGNGTCDEFAVKKWPAGKSKGKNWPAGSKTINLKDWASKKK